MKSIIVYTLISILSFVTGCASSPSNMTPKHQSSMAYKGQECSVLTAELDAINSELSVLNKELQTLYTNDVWQFWGGLLLLWPLWIFLEYGDWSKADRYKELMGQRDAVERSMAVCV